MGLKDTLNRELRELFTGWRTRNERRQSEFHLKVAAPLRDHALAHDLVLWKDYVLELERALVALPSNFEARWLRCQALYHYFTSFRPGSKEPEARRYAMMWDTDLKWLLINFPDKEPEGTSLRQARDLREEFDRLCRGYKLT